MSQSYHIVHASSQECDVLDKLQSFSQLWDGNPGVRIYTNGLEKAFENPDFLRSFLSYSRQHFSKGGRVGIDRMSPEEIESARESGRFGDTCLAIIGPRTRAAMDMLCPTAGSSNPTTGFPEYFSLGNIFSGIGNAFSGLTGGIGNALSGITGGLGGMLKNIGGGLFSAAGQALPSVLGALGPVAGGALGARFGGPTGAALGEQLGGAAGNALGGMGQQVFNQFGQSLSPEGANHPSAAALGQNLGSMVNNMSQGMPMNQAASQMFAHSAPHVFGNSPMGQGISNFANNMHQGQGFMPSMQNAFQQTGGFGPAAQAAQNAYQAYSQGASPMGAMRQGASYLTQPQSYGPQMQ